MSYVSSYVHAQPQGNVVATENIVKQSAAVKATVRKEATTKILLFVAIVTCLVLAINI